MSYGSLLSSVLIKKLPSELQLILSRDVGEEGWEFNDLLKKLQDEIAARERVEGPLRSQRKIVGWVLLNLYCYPITHPYVATVNNNIHQEAVIQSLELRRGKKS